uniref:ATP-dependent Clp protease proteolytic subunit n=1 Tax=Coelastrum microporum TaxID=55409 RepID=UPI00226CA512|nr:ATP-dependent Clp protease proteolytic subunit [Coelastrum microporum]UWM13092.1 ATP-dependent Clp protease proteolytic subunit [Coelastrum microporum]
MPIGVPRIIYCWGEELPAQWTDIYNFIFRRRMVFLMQYLDDELCNQICGLLINIHMEDRSKELEKKEMENSGLFKSSTSQKKASASGFGAQMSGTNQFSTSAKKKERSIEDLMISEEDLAIDENNMLETHTLQKISLEWLNWNSQFFDYSEEPYLFYLAELLAKDMTGNNAGLLSTPFNDNQSMSDKELAKLMMFFKQMNTSDQTFSAPGSFSSRQSNNQKFDIYSPFRLLANKISDGSFNSKDFELSGNFQKKLQQFVPSGTNRSGSFSSENQFDSFVSDIANKELLNSFENPKNKKNFSEKAFTQRQLRRDYSQENLFSRSMSNKQNQALNYLNPDQLAKETAYLEYRDSYRKQTEKALQDEESKKVFMVINSFGGSVGNGITIHDALQFIKAGSMTLALGVAASAASLALAGGTIGERYVTEGCHVMMHQPEGGLTGQASDIWIDSQEILKIRLDVAEIYSLSTYRPRHKILRDLDRDFYLTAMETIYYGLADEIATNEVMHSIIEMTSKVWDYHDTQQQKLLESRDSATAGFDTQTQN